MNDRKITNTERCLCCPSYGFGRCSLLADAHVSDIDKCIKEYDFYRYIAKGSLEEYLLRKEPTLLLMYISKSRPLNVGDIVVTLTGGFRTCYSGKLLKIVDEDDVQFTLIDRSGYKFCVSTETWYEKVFKLDDQKFE